MLTKFWVDDNGAIISAELVLLMTIVVIGLITGMVALRNMIVTELADVGAAIGALNQSYSFSGTAIGTSSPCNTAGSSWADGLDPGDNGMEQGGTTSAGISLVEPPMPEGS